MGTCWLQIQISLSYLSGYYSWGVVPGANSLSQIGIICSWPLVFRDCYRIQMLSYNNTTLSPNHHPYNTHFSKYNKRFICVLICPHYSSAMHHLHYLCGKNIFSKAETSFHPGFWHSLDAWFWASHLIFLDLNFFIVTMTELYFSDLWGPFHLSNSSHYTWKPQ